MSTTLPAYLDSGTSSPSMDLALKSESVYKSGVLRSVIDSKLARDTSTHRVT